MAAETERWELEIELPPVTETIRLVEVQCGATIATVELLQDGWAASAGIGSPMLQRVTKPREDRESAVVDASWWVVRQERMRLLRSAVEPSVLHAEAQAGATGAAGEPRV